MCVTVNRHQWPCGVGVVHRHVNKRPVNGPDVRPDAGVRSQRARRHNRQLKRPVRQARHKEGPRRARHGAGPNDDDGGTVVRQRRQPAHKVTLGEGTRGATQLGIPLKVRRRVERWGQRRQGEGRRDAGASRTGRLPKVVAREARGALVGRTTETGRTANGAHVVGARRGRRRGVGRGTRTGGGWGGGGRH